MFVCLITLTLLCSKQTLGSKTSRVSKQKADGGKDETVRMLLNWELWSLWFWVKYLTCVIYAPFEHCFRGSSAHYRGWGSSVPWGCGNTHSIPAICLQGFSVFWLSKEANVGRLWGGMNSICKVCENLGYVWASCQDFEDGGGGGCFMKEFYFSKSLSQLALHGSLERHGLRMRRTRDRIGRMTEMISLECTKESKILHIRHRDSAS